MMPMYISREKHEEAGDEDIVELKAHELCRHRN